MVYFYNVGIFTVASSFAKQHNMLSSHNLLRTSLALVRNSPLSASCPLKVLFIELPKVLVVPARSVVVDSVALGNVALQLLLRIPTSTSRSSGPHGYTSAWYTTTAAPSGYRKLMASSILWGQYVSRHR